MAYLEPTKLISYTNEDTKYPEIKVFTNDEWMEQQRKIIKLEQEQRNNEFKLPEIIN